MVIRDASGFLIKKDWLKTKRSSGRPRADSFRLSDESTAEFLWQAKSSRGDFHAAMNDDTFMVWLKHRLTPAFREQFGEKKVIFVPHNAPYHHGFDPISSLRNTIGSSYFAR